MVRFTSLAALSEQLEDWDPEFRQYSTVLWDQGLRSSEALAKAPLAVLMSHVSNQFHAASIHGLARVTVACGGGGGGGSATASSAARRIMNCGKYGAHIKRQTLSGEVYKTAAVVVDEVHVATYAHVDHAGMCIGNDIEVFVNDLNGAQRKPVTFTVKVVNTTIDVVIMRAKDPSITFEAPILDATIYPGEPYFILGQSTQANKDETSVSHGQIAATDLDLHCHVRGDTLTGSGDSGGAVFSADTSKLIAMCVGKDDISHKSILVPVSVILSLIPTWTV